MLGVSLWSLGLLRPSACVSGYHHCLTKYKACKPTSCLPCHDTPHAHQNNSTFKFKFKRTLLPHKIMYFTYNHNECYSTFSNKSNISINIHHLSYTSINTLLPRQAVATPRRHSQMHFLKSNISINIHHWSYTSINTLLPRQSDRRP